MPVASGTFDIQMHPEPPFDLEGGLDIGYTRFTKRFNGELDAESTVYMTSIRNMAVGSGAYVALERVRGSLGGRRGSFVLVHTGIMDRGAQSLTLAVVPDSGTGDLAGLRGTMQIDTSGGGHRYTFDYSPGT